MDQTCNNLALLNYNIVSVAKNNLLGLNMRISFSILSVNIFPNDLLKSLGFIV